MCEKNTLLEINSSVMELIVTRFWLEQNHLSSENQNSFHWGQSNFGCYTQQSIYRDFFRSNYETIVAGWQKIMLGKRILVWFLNTRKTNRAPPEAQDNRQEGLSGWPLLQVSSISVIVGIIDVSIKTYAPSIIY